MNFKNRWRKAQTSEINRALPLVNKYKPASVTEYWRPVLYQHLSIDFDYFRGKRVLDIGCGYDGMIHCLTSSSIRVGVDPLCHAYRDFYVSRDGYYGYVHHMTAIGENLPFKDSSFDAIISYNVIDHSQSPDKTIMEINRVLAKGGSLILAVNTFSRLPKIIRQSLHLIDRPHLYHLSDREVGNLCQNANLRVVFHAAVKEATLKSLFNWYLPNRYLLDSIKFLIALLIGMRRSHYICVKSNEANT